MQIGDRLPVNSLPDEKGSMIDLSNYKGPEADTVFLSQRQYAGLHE
jgi:peroxiredoxin